MVEMRKDMLQMFCSNQQVNSVTHSCETCAGPHSYYECQVTGGYTQDVYATTGNYNAAGNTYQPQVIEIKKSLQERPHGALPNNTIPNPCEEIKAITTQSGNVLAGPSVLSPSSSSSSSKEVERDPRMITDQMFKKLHLNISLAEALALMSKYHKMLKDLLFDKEKLLGLSNTPLTENCSTVLLKKLPEKLGDPRKFLIPCDFPELEKCMALADLAGIAEDVFVQVGKFTFLADFVVVDYDVDPCVPLILGRPFLRTARALVDVYREELILRDDDEKLIFHADSTSKYPHKHGDDTTQIPLLFKALIPDMTMHAIILYRISHGMVYSSRSSFYLGLLFPEGVSESYSFDLFKLGDENVVFDPGTIIIKGWIEHYYGGDIPAMDVPDLHFSPKDK
ncbi:reverse transcriptase domain-containing protein [Tanacetum coccineum]